MSYLKGSDVASPYQDANYPTTGQSFVWVKATQGASYTNPQMGAQIQHGLSNGLVVGVYHFLTALAPVSQQLAWFEKHVNVKPGYGIAVDWEEYEGKWPTNAAKDEMIQGLKGLYPRNRVVLYTNKDGWLNHDRTSYCGDGLWIADPGTPGNVSVKHPWVFHQWGIRNNVDQDVANFPDMHSMKVWLGLETATVPIGKGGTAVDGQKDTTNYSQEPGFDQWHYENPKGGPDAWSRLLHVERMLERLCDRNGVDKT